MGTVKVMGRELEEDSSKIKELHAPDYETGFLRHLLESEEWIADDVRGNAFYLKSHYAV